MNWLRTVVTGIILIGWSCGPLPAEPPALESSAVDAAPRTTVVVVPFENMAADPQELHWSRATGGRISTLLKSVGSIRIIPGAGYGLRQSGIAAGDPIDRVKAQRIGELTDARWVVWGSWEKAANEWVLTTHVQRTVDDEPADGIEARDEDWFSVLAQTTHRILEVLGIEATDAERRKLEERPTDSPEACELFARLYVLHEQNASLEKIEALIREVIKIDPDWGTARCILATALFNQGKTSEAEELLRQLLKDDPESADNHLLAGQMLFFHSNDNAGAEKELREAIRLAPDEADAYEALAAVCASQERWEDALVPLTKARELNPFDPGTHALLGLIHIRMGNRQAGLRALQEAERFDDDNINAELRLASGYRRLAEFSKAVQHYERSLALGRKMGTPPAKLRSLEKQLQFARERLTATPVEALRPRTFSAEELRAELAKRLTPEELAMAVIPFEINQEMKAWVREATADAESDLDRARTLFDALVHRVRGRGKGGSRTAREVFAMWEDPETTLSCQEYGKLFVGLGREIGLDAFYVHLEKDCHGRILYHDCAALFLDGKAWLVDPAYRWFGAPHQEFEILDDLQTVAHHAFQGRDDGTGIAPCRMALKLHPDHAWGQLATARALTSAGELDAAEKHLAKAAELDPDRWDWFLIRGIIAGRRDDFRASLRHMREAAALNPDNSQVQYFLGMALTSLANHEEALEAYRAALRHDDGYHDELIEDARKKIAILNEAMAMLDGDATAVNSVRRRADAGDTEAQNNLAVYFTNRSEPDYVEAERWSKLAVSQGNLGAYDTLGVALLGQGRVDEATEAFRHAVEADPDSATTQMRLGVALEKQGRPDQAVAAWEKALELDPSAAEYAKRLANITARAGQFDRCGYWVARLAMMNSAPKSESALIAMISGTLGKLKVEIPVTPPSENAIRDYFEAHRELFGNQAVHLRILCISKESQTMEFMKALHAKLASGEDLTTAAKEHGTDWAAEQGGDRGWVERDELRADLEQAAFALDDGQVSKLLEDDTHYRILQVVESRQNEKISLDAVKDQVVEAIRNEERCEKIKTWIAAARRDLGRGRQ